MQLYRCESCKKTVSSGRSLKRHRSTCKQFQLEYGQLKQKSTDNMSSTGDSRRLDDSIKKNLLSRAKNRRLIVCFLVDSQIQSYEGRINLQFRLLEMI